MAATKTLAAPAAGGGIATERSPGFSLPLRFFLFGAAGYLAAMGALAYLGPALVEGGTWSPRLLALTHLLALGFILPMIMGASYQLVPVVLLATIRHERLGQLGFWPYAVGVVAMIAGFWSWTPLLLAVGGSLVVLGFAIFVLTVALSLARGAEWGEMAGFFLSSVGAMLAAAAIGLARVIGFAAPDHALILPNGLTAHASLATMGCASLLIYGVAYRLVPMFSVGHEIKRFGPAVLITGGLGVGAIAAGSLAQWPIAVQLGMTASSIAAWLWAFDAWQLFRGRTRRRLDTGLTYAAVSIAYLLVSSLLGLALSFNVLPGGIAPERWTIAFAVLGLVGWLGFSIVGYFHKILPFLAWYHRYSALLGKRKVPLIRDLFNERSAWVGFWSSQLGLVILVASLFGGPPWGVSLAGGLLFLGALAMVRMVAECLTR